MKDTLYYLYKGSRCIALKDRKQDTEITEKLRFGILLAFIGGFMDVYSYAVRGKVFATGQTSNFALAAVRLVEKDYTGMFHAIVPIVSFWIGIFISWYIFYSHFKERHLLWKRGILVIEMVILFIAGLVPLSYSNIIANTLVSFAASLQYCAFRKFGTDEGYASIFCTGNMRSCAENYYMGIVRKDRQCLKKALRYSCILVSFFTGAVTGAFEASIFHEKAIWTVDVILLAALVISFVFNADISKNTALTE
jgi:Predicted membrane protein